MSTGRLKVISGTLAVGETPISASLSSSHSSDEGNGTTKQS